LVACSPAGIVAACLAVGFAELFGEPQVALAIAFESSMDAAAGMAPEPELVSRAVQRSIGLLTAGVMYGAAYGGLFSLVFAFCYGRIGRIGPRGLAALLACGGFLAVVLVPDLKYPANPPSVGEPETIGLRTLVYFEMLLLSLASLALSAIAWRKLVARVGAWNASLLAGALFVVLIFVLQLALPDINEVPDEFPAVVLWRFRIAALGMQIVLWGALGAIFGALAERVLGYRAPHAA
jgi:hypothetical protein